MAAAATGAFYAIKYFKGLGNQQPEPETPVNEIVTPQTVTKVTSTFHGKQVVLLYDATYDGQEYEIDRRPSDNR